MPPATLFQVDTECGERKPVSSYSYKAGESFADARLKLETQFDFAFHFIDVNLATRMLQKWEKHNLIEDCGGKIVIIPQTSSEPPIVPSQNGFGIVQQVLGSSNASTNPSVTESVHRDDVPLTAEPEIQPGVNSVSPLQETELQVSLGSELMSDELKRVWSFSVDRLRIHMDSINCVDHRWRVKTWDRDSIPWGHLECCECQKRVEGVGKNLLMSKISIQNAFTNFKNSHMRSAKHAARVALNRGERVEPQEIVRRAQSNVLSDRAILVQHLEIVSKVNQTFAVAVGRETFTVQGDVAQEPVELHRFKLFCNFCLHHLTFIPRQRNLEPNLTSHCTDLTHLDYVAKSQRATRNEPVLSRRPGRPRTVDGRDLKQRKIQGFMTCSSTGGASNSSSWPSGQHDNRGISDNHSLLCWGLWRDVIQVRSESRPIKSLLHDQIKSSGVWYAEPSVREQILCLSTGDVCDIKGLFRHKDCNRLSTLGGGFEDLTCSNCYSIQNRVDFRLRVFRELTAMEKRGERGIGKGRRLDYLTVPEVRDQSKRYRSYMLRDRRLQRYLSHKLLMLKARVPTIKEVCLDYQESNKASVLKFCQSIVLVHSRGAFGGRSALWDMLSDIASNLNTTKTGYRYKAGTKLLCQTLFLHGGRRVVDCLASNRIGPSLNTLQRHRRGMAEFRVGIHEEQFQFISKVYSQLKIRMNIAGPIPCYLAEDETCIKRTVRWMPKHDTLVGFCGSKIDHKCHSGWEIEVGSAETGFNKIVEAFENNTIGHQARCVIVNPLVEGLPRLCILATATCNKFDASWVRDQWEFLELLWKTHCLQTVGPLLGHASDGDARRRKLMLQDYTGRRIQGPRVTLRWEGWQLSHSVTNDGLNAHAVGLHDQDYIHNGKKLVNPLDSSTRILKLGTEVANLSHLIHLYDLYDPKDHGLNKEDIRRNDRQNWASAQRLCSRKVCATLHMLRTRNDARVELTLGTEVYIRICADYLDIFMNSTLTLRDKIVLCGKVSFFFRLWRLWCFHVNHTVGGNTQLISFTRNCIPMQTFLDIQMSVHFVVLLVIQFRDHFRHLPVPLHLTGSDACEQFFSKVGGMRGHERSYDVTELVECATNLNRLAAMDLATGMMGVGKSHKKHTNIWMSLHSLQQESHTQPDYARIESNVEIVAALQEGLELAQNAATELQMNPSTSCRDSLWWNCPWKVEAKGIKFGGWCDVNVDALLDLQDILDGETSTHDFTPETNSSMETETSIAAASREDVSLETDDRDLDSDLEVATSQLEATHDILHSDLIYGTPAKNVIPPVSFQDREIYKSTLVNQLVGNPHLSKDRLTRVKQSIYFNNLVDRSKHKDGVPTMFMTVGSDCGVFFLDETPEVIRVTRNSEAGSRTSKRKSQGGKAQQNMINPKRPRGEPIAVCSISGLKYAWWIGRVQSIHKKYGNSVGRSREALDLLDRPNADAGCKVVFNWFTPVGPSRHKFAYNMCDPQIIDLDCVISTVSLTVDPLYPSVFKLHPDDVVSLDNYVKNNIE